MFGFIQRLFPITRSITGDGVRETLRIISGRIPLEVHEIPTGTKVLDWEIPEEWNIRDAWIKDPNGNKVIDYQNSNLHVLNYSTPVHDKMGLEMLQEHLYTDPEQPDGIPYRTSYHNRNWGFCLSQNQYNNLEKGEYEVFIDSTLTDGSLSYGEYFVKGKTSDEVLISTHICHPSLANDNLSGIAVSTFLAEHLSKIETRYSYRFVFVPVTIGSIAWLSQNEQQLERIKHGLVLTLLGDESHFHYKRSRMGNAMIDKVVEQALTEKGTDFEIRDFSPYGYDERQYCSPGFNLPLGRLSRKPHGEFPEYHTSADNLDFVKPDRLEESLEMVLSIIERLENNRTFLNLSPKGEPQLGKRGLFKKIGGQGQSKDAEMALLWILNQSDGDHSLLDIAIKSGLPFKTITQAANALEEVQLIKAL
jgi:aminopeptidase-like protein